MNEIWKPIVGLEGRYEVSNLGNIRSVDICISQRNGYKRILKGREIKTFINNSGYLKFTACTGARHYVTKLVHRAVAEAFLPNPNPSLLVEVNHINEDKLDNRVDNLSWITHFDNIKYCSCIEKITNSQKRTPLIATNLITGEVRYFESTKEAGRNGFSLSCIWKCCRGMTSQTKGWKFEYAKGETSN